MRQPARVREVGEVVGEQQQRGAFVEAVVVVGFEMRGHRQERSELLQRLHEGGVEIGG